jgi:predicted extracellular nuclease
MVFSIAAKAELNVMTLNAEWLWTPYDGSADGSKFNRGDMDKASYLKEIAFYASIVKSNDVDILAISEIENKYVARDLANKLGKGWVSHFVQGRDTATGQDLALLSRLSIVEGSLTNFGFPCGKAPGAKKRKCLSKVVGASFHLTGRSNSQVHVITSHFLSKRNESRAKTLKRQSQAVALLQAIKLNSADLAEGNNKLIVLGDFNDTYHSEVIRLLREEGGLKGALDCPNETKSVEKRRLRAIDHILFKGFTCIKEYAVNTYGYSDHDAIIANLK